MKRGIINFLLAVALFFSNCSFIYAENTPEETESTETQTEEDSGEITGIESDTDILEEEPGPAVDTNDEQTDITEYDESVNVEKVEEYEERSDILNDNTKNVDQEAEESNSSEILEDEAQEIVENSQVTGEALSRNDEQVQETDTVFFGSYFQTHLEDNDLIRILNKLPDTEDNVYTWEGIRYKWIKKRGYFEEEPIEWTILDEGADSVTLISTKVIDMRDFDPNVVGGTFWNESSIRNWLNNDFYNIAFNDSEKKKILTKVNTTLYWPYNDAYVDKKDPQYVQTEDKVYLLDLDDAQNPDYGFENTADASPSRVAYATQYADDQERSTSWWLRGPGRWNAGSLQERYVRYDGSLTSWYGTYSYGIRPVITIQSGVTEWGGSFSKEFFEGTSHEYNHELAILSLSMAMSAFNSKQTEAISANDYEYDKTILKTSPASKIYKAMGKCGFDNIMVNKDYLITTEYEDGVNDGNNIGVCIGSQPLDDGSTLIAVALRGGNYGDEWIGNFSVCGSGIEHLGFGLAKSTVLQALYQYVSDNNINGDVKVWIMGYSRAGAVANLTAAYLCKKGLPHCNLSSDHVFAYTFEAPRGTKSTDYNADIYNGIYNIVNPDDVVPLLAMREWGYKRYGRDLYFPDAAKQPEEFKMYEQTVLDYLNIFTGDKFDKIPRNKSQSTLVKTLVGFLASIVGDENSTLAYALKGEIQAKYETNHFTIEMKEGLAVGLVLIINRCIKNPLRIFKYLKLAKELKDNIDDIAQAHEPALTLSWLNSVNGLYFDVPYRNVLVNRPVNLAVYSGDVLQFTVINNEIVYEEEALIEAMIDKDEQIIITVPQDKNIRVEVLATDDGTFNYSVQTGDMENGITSIVNYNDVEIKEGDKYIGTVSTLEENKYTLETESGELIEATEELEGTDIETYLITVEAGEGGKTSENTYKLRGEFCELIAEPNEGYQFEGWYKDGELVSTDPEYKFRVEQNETYIGKFKGYLEMTANESKDIIQIYYTDEESDNYQFKVENDSIATIDSSGVLSAVRIGKTKLIVKDIQNNTEFEITINVLFDDVTKPSQYYYDAVYWAVENNITQGMGPTTFNPGGFCKRYQFVLFLWRQAGCPEPELTEDPFTDVLSDPKKDVYEKAVLWAVDQEITTGTTPTTFDPYAPLTRGQVVTFLYRAAGKPEVSTTTNPFRDLDSSKYYYTPVLWAVENEITTGLNKTQFGPTNTCTRGQTVLFMYRLFK